MIKFTLIFAAVIAISSTCMASEAEQTHTLMEVNTEIQGEAISSSDKICIIGDSGKDTLGRENVFKALKKEGCTELRVTGDIIYRKGLVGDVENKVRLFEEHVLYLKKLNIPVYIVLGNHDDEGDEDLMIKLSRENGINYPNHFYSQQRGAVCFVSIFTDVTGAKDIQALGKSQKEWFANETNKLSNECNFLVGVAHHIYKTNGFHRNDEALGAAFYENEVVGKYDMFLSGHDHHLEDVGDYGGTRFLISGAAAKARRLLDKEKWHEQSKWAVGKSHGYITLEFNGNCEDKAACEATYKFYVVDEQGEASMEYENSIKP